MGCVFRVGGCLRISLARFKRKVAAARVRACWGAGESAGLCGLYALRGGPPEPGKSSHWRSRDPGGCRHRPPSSCSGKSLGGSTRGPGRRETEGGGRPGSCEPVRGCGRGAREGGERAREGAQRARRPAPALPARRPRRLPPARTAACCRRRRRRCSRRALLGSRAATAGFVLPAEDESDLFLSKSCLRRESARPIARRRAGPGRGSIHKAQPR